MDSYEEDLRAYAKILTPYAFKRLQKQIELAKIVTVQVLPKDKIVVKSHARGQVIVTLNACECTYPVKMGLPCRHILKAGNMLKISRFDLNLFQLGGQLNIMIGLLEKVTHLRVAPATLKSSQYRKSVPHSHKHRNSTKQ